MVCTESGCAKDLEVSHRDICEGGERARGEETYLNEEFE